jgi:hypothetical protein
MYSDQSKQLGTYINLEYLLITLRSTKTHLMVEDDSLRVQPSPEYKVQDAPNIRRVIRRYSLLQSTKTVPIFISY